ncbi:MAG: sigma-70 family RNA polymerase sigma factor [Alistipes finegoldii]
MFRLLKNPGEAEDVTQNIFLRVWEKRRELGGTRSLRSYLYTMARNAVFDIFSHSIVEDKYMQEHINSAAERRDARQRENRDRGAGAAHRRRRGPHARTAPPGFSLSRYEELSNKEIAERLNLSVKTVERHMTAA